MFEVLKEDFRKLNAVEFIGFDNTVGKEVKGISIDSRTIKKDEIFLVIMGERLDGHK